MKTAAISLFILASACLATTIFGCSCRRRTFKEVYDRAESVVTARVVSIEPLIPICDEDACPTFEPGLGYILVKLRLIKKNFKGCGPSKRIFYVKTGADSSFCGVPFGLGRSYMLNLRRRRGNGSESRPYRLDFCEFHRQFSTLTRPEKRMLRLFSKLPKNQCRRP